MSVPKLRFPEFVGAGDWIKTVLSDIGEVLQGYGFPEVLQGKKHGEYPFCKVSDISTAISSGKHFIDNAANYVDKDDLNLLKAKTIPIGTTIFAKIGEAIRSNRRVITTSECLIDNNVAGVKAINGKADDLYIFHILSRINLIEYSGGAVPSVNKSTLENILVFKTLPTEQQKIADCLSSLDSLITGETQKLHALKTHKKGLMQQMFPAEGETIPKLRFPEFQDAGEWDELPFKEIAKFLSGGTPSKNIPEYWEGTIPWISASSMHSTKIEKSDSNITDLAVSEGARIVKKGTLLLLVRGSMLHKRIPIGISGTDVAFNQDVKALELKGDITEPYLMNFLIASEPQLLAAVTATGIGAGKLDTNDLNDFLIRFPLPLEQQKIANCLSSLDELITTQAQKIDTLKTHKKGLMQQLFPAAVGEHSEPAEKSYSRINFDPAKRFEETKINNFKHSSRLEGLDIISSDKNTTLASILAKYKRS